MSNTLSPHDLLWCVRRLPRPVVALCKAHPNDVFIAGGYIRSRITGERVNDVDLFVKNAASARTFALEVVGGDDPVAAEKRLHTTANAITVKRIAPTVQFIHRWTFEHPTDIIQSFDFTIASAVLWWDGGNWRSTCHGTFYADLAAKRLVYLSPKRNEDAGGSLLRVLKFYQRGYRIPLDSMGAVIARLVMGVKGDGLLRGEEHAAKILTGLLREVDPNLDPDHIAHLPTIQGDDVEGAVIESEADDADTSDDAAVEDPS